MFTDKPCPQVPYPHVFRTLPWAACSNPWQPFLNRIFPNIPSKPPLAQQEIISSHPVPNNLGEGTDSTLIQPPFSCFWRVIMSPLSLFFSRLVFPNHLPFCLEIQVHIFLLQISHPCCKIRANFSSLSCFFFP